MNQLPIYLDNHSTTPMDPRVLEHMVPFFVQNFGNASSKNHCFGWKVAEMVDKSRRKIGECLGAHETEIVFTSGATESNNTAIKGSARQLKAKGNHIVTSSIEHKSVLDSCEYLRNENFEISYVKPNTRGIIEVDAVKEALRPNTILMSFMLANNEIGMINPIAEIGELAKEKGIIFHCDAVQGFGRIPCSVADLNADLVSISAHKIYGPKGVGALFVKKTTGRFLEPLIHGGGQEHGLRSGTLNVPGIVGMAQACELAIDELVGESIRILQLRNLLLKELKESTPQLQVNGALENRLPGNLNLSFGDIDGNELMLALCQQLAVSAGSACSSSSQKPSHVLGALALPLERIHSSLRFGIGRFNSESDIRNAAQLVGSAVKKIRAKKSNLVFLS